MHTVPRPTYRLQSGDGAGAGAEAAGDGEDVASHETIMVFLITMEGSIDRLQGPNTRDVAVGPRADADDGDRLRHVRQAPVGLPARDVGRTARHATEDGEEKIRTASSADVYVSVRVVVSRTGLQIRRLGWYQTMVAQAGENRHIILG